MGSPALTLMAWTHVAADDGETYKEEAWREWCATPVAWHAPV